MRAECALQGDYLTAAGVGVMNGAIVMMMVIEVVAVPGVNVSALCGCRGDVRVSCIERQQQDAEVQ